MNDIRLSYCRVCINRDFNLQIGTFCKLTQKKPDFGSNCPKYGYDNNEYERLIDRKLDYYNKLDKQGHKIGMKINLNTITYKPTKIDYKNRISSIHQLPKTIEIKDSVSHYILFHIVPSLIFIFWISREMDDIVKYGGFGVIAIFSGVIIWAIYKIKIDNKPKIIIDEKGIELIKIGIIPWRDIALAIIKSKQDKFRNECLCISRLSSYEDIEIDISRLEMTSLQLGHNIEMYKKKYQNLK